MAHLLNGNVLSLCQPGGKHHSGTNVGTTRSTARTPSEAAPWLSPAWVHRWRCRVLYVRNLPFNISSEEMYDIFGKYGALRQVRVGDSKETRGTAFVVYEVGAPTATAAACPDSQAG